MIQSKYFSAARIWLQENKKIAIREKISKRQIEKKLEKGWEKSYIKYE